jgi:hypothetical protein
VRIIVFLNSKLYIRNYLTTNAFGNIKGHQLNFLLPEELVSTAIETKKIDKTKISSFRTQSVDWLRRGAFNLNSRLEMFEKSTSNPTFLFRLRRELMPHLQAVFTVRRWYEIKGKHIFFGFFIKWFYLTLIYKQLLIFTKFLRFLSLDVLGLIEYYLIVLIVRSGLKPSLSGLLVKRIPLDRDLLGVMRIQRSDLIVIPSSVVDMHSFELMRIVNFIGFGKVLLLVDNWDNLSSKSSLILKPDFMGVWGHQSIEFAKNIHGIEPSRITPLGTPRFDVYKNYRRSSTLTDITGNKLVRFPYILFAGCSVDYDEIEAVRALSVAVSSLSSFLPEGTKILYRPHPWGARIRYLQLLDENPLENVFVDPQIMAGRGLKGKDFQPKLDYYPKLLDEAILVVCPLSTMIVEATIMRKRVIALAHDDEVSVTSPNRMLAFYRHFEGLDKLENLQLVRDLTQLKQSIRRAVEAGDLMAMPVGLNFYVEMKEPQYAERLARLIDSIEFRISNEHSV